MHESATKTRLQFADSGSESNRGFYYQRGEEIVTTFFRTSKSSLNPGTMASRRFWMKILLEPTYIRIKRIFAWND